MHSTGLAHSCRRIGFVVVGLLLLASGCRTLGPPDEERPSLVDPDASDETRALYYNLHRLSAEATLFGHHDDLAYGVHWTIEDGLAQDTLTSDVERVTGAYPAVYGWDVARVVDWTDESDDPEDDENDKEKERVRNWILEGYDRGGVITMPWHMDNPVSGGNSWDTTRAVAKMLPDSSHHEIYVDKLDQFAAFAKSLETGFWSWLGLGHEVPIIFRPFHEMNGHWFWWGVASPEDFKALWRFTVEYLRDEKELDNLLYAYSPDIFDSRDDYLEHYPGDEYVDVLGYDDYHTLTAYNRLARLDTVAVDAPTADTVLARPSDSPRDTAAVGTAAVGLAEGDTATGDATPVAPDSVGLDSVYADPGQADSMAAAEMAENFRVVAKEAAKRDKVAAMTEGGLEGLPDANWWTARLLPTLTHDEWTRRITYVSVWRNAPHTQIEGHFYAPYPGQKSADDFVGFYEHPFIRFEDELPELYDLP